MLPTREQTIKAIKELKDPIQLQKQRQMDAKRKYEQLLAQVNLIYDETTGDKKERTYSQDLLPYIHFYKLLARKPDSEQSNTSIINRLQLWIPDTIVLNDKDIPNYWLYSDQRGYVFRTDTFTAKNVISKLANYTSPDELVAVIKKQQFRLLEMVGNETKLVCCRDLQGTVSTLFSNRMDLTVIQKYIKSNGPKAFICRTIWRKDRNPISYVITNKEDYFKEGVKNETQKYITNANQMGTCTIVSTCRGKYVEETLPYVKNLINYIHIHLGVTFKEFSGDFVKDESGIWWFINVKGYIIDKSPAKILWRSITHYGEELPADEDGEVIMTSLTKSQKLKGFELTQKQKICKYCEQLYPEQHLQYKMTLKMIILTDKHLYWRGKTFPWISRSDVTNLEISNLYHEHKVCKQCYLIFKETEQLVELQLQFNKLLGLPSTMDTMYNMLTLKANEVNNDPLKPTESFQEEVTEQEQVFDISATKQLVLDQMSVPMIHNTVIKNLNRFRFMILINSIRDVPTVNVDLNKHYTIDCTIFDQKFKVKLDIGSGIKYEKGYFITLNRMRMFYFFSHQRKGWAEYINQIKALQMNLYADSDRIGTLELDLQDLLSERVIRKEYFKVFSVKKDMFPILSWGLNVTLGLVDSGPVNVTRIKLTEHHGIQLPNPDYCTCEPLPAEWMTILNLKKDNEIQKDGIDRLQTSQTLKRAQTSLNKVNRKYDINSIIEPSQREDIHSFQESTNELYSAAFLQKEISEYEIDEDERRKKKKKRLRPIYDL